MAKKKKVDEVLKEEVINEEEKDNKNIEIISLDNQPVSPIIAEEESEEVPRNFVPARKPVKTSKKVAKHLIHNGRVYKPLNNGRGMYADTGETFDLREVK